MYFLRDTQQPVGLRLLIICNMLIIFNIVVWLNNKHINKINELRAKSDRLLAPGQNRPREE